MAGSPRRVIILGAAGRDFHDFNAVFRDDPGVEVVAFTAAQIPGIAGRRYPPALAGARYPDGIPIEPEEELESLVAAHHVDEVVFAYSDVSHEHVMHLASRALAAGAGFTMLGPRRTMLRSVRPVVAVCAVRTGCGKGAVSRRVAGILRTRGLRVGVVRHPMPYGDLEAQRVQRFATLRGPGSRPGDTRGARGVRASHRVGKRRVGGGGLCRPPRFGRGRGGRDRVGRWEQRSALLRPHRASVPGRSPPRWPRGPLPSRRGQPPRV